MPIWRIGKIATSSVTVEEANTWEQACRQAGWEPTDCIDISSHWCPISITNAPTLRDLNLPWTLHITQTGGVVLDQDRAAVCFVDRMMVETVREMIRRLNEAEKNAPMLDPGPKP